MHPPPPPPFRYQPASSWPSPYLDVGDGTVATSGAHGLQAWLATGRIIIMGLLATAQPPRYGGYISFSAAATAEAHCADLERRSKSPRCQLSRTFCRTCCTQWMGNVILYSAVVVRYMLSEMQCQDQHKERCELPLYKWLAQITSIPETLRGPGSWWRSPLAEGHNLYFYQNCSEQVCEKAALVRTESS